MSDYSERLREQFLTEKQHCQRWLVAALLFGVFYVFVFVPYLNVLTDLAKLEASQKNIGEKIASSKKEADTAESAMGRIINFLGGASDYRLLYRDAETWVRSIDELEQLYDKQTRLLTMLRESLDTEQQQKWKMGEKPDNNVILSLRKTHPDIMKRYDDSPDYIPGVNIEKNKCFFQLERDWLLCMLKRKYRPIDKKLFRVLYNRTSSHNYTKRLKKLVSANQDIYQSGIDAAIDQGNIKQLFQQYLEKEQTIIRQWYEEVLRERNELKRTYKKLEKDQEQYQVTQTILEERKKNLSQTGKINTPIGQITLAFHDLLAFAPALGLFILFAMVKSLNRQLVLREAFQQHAIADLTHREALLLTLPMWIDRYKPLATNILVIIVLFLAAATLMLGLWQILTNPGLKLADISHNTKLIITLTVLVAAMFIFYLIYLVQKLLSQLKQNKSAS